MSIVVEHGSVRYVECHMNDLYRVHMVAEHVNYLRADGDELEHIRRKMKNIPMTDGTAVYWYGDIAKFIAGNL